MTANPNVPRAPRPSRPSRRPSADCKDSLRQDILDAARELFVSEGYGSVSLRKIALQVGCTPMAIYCHFEDKAEILDSICEETFTCFAAIGDRLDREGLAPRERLRAGLRNYIEFGLAHPHHYQLTFMQPPGDPEAAGRREEIGRRAFERLRNQVAACLEAGGRASGTTDDLEDDVDVASQLIWASVHGLVSLLIVRPRFPWAERERLIATTLENATERLRCPGARDAAERISA
jgi:AcrR family transcriptional regulator